MTAWIKKHWGKLVAIAIFAIAVIVWIVSRKSNPWAAQKILEIQGDIEQKAERIEQKKIDSINKLDQVWQAKRRSLVAKEQEQIRKAIDETRKLNAAALKRKLLEDLDDPL